MSIAAETLTVNEGFWSKAYNENFESLCARASRRLTHGNATDAEDVVSEAFLRGMKYAQNPDEIKNVVSYLWTAVKRVWGAQQVRLSATNTEHLEDLTSDQIEAIRVDPEIQRVLESKAEFRRMLGPISLEEERVVKLRLEGYKFEEVAEVMNETPELIRYRWNNFIRRQRSRLTVRNSASLPPAA